MMLKTPYGKSSVKNVKVYIAKLNYLSFKELSAGILAFAINTFLWKVNKFLIEINLWIYGK